jgi:hypothetical protein
MTWCGIQDLCFHSGEAQYPFSSSPPFRSLQVIQGAHAGAVSSLYFFPREPLLLSGGGDNSLKMWIFDAADGTARLLKSRQGHTAPPRRIRYCPSPLLMHSLLYAAPSHLVCSISGERQYVAVLPSGLLSFAAIAVQLLYGAPSHLVCSISGYRQLYIALKPRPWPLGPSLIDQPIPLRFDTGGGRLRFHTLPGMMMMMRMRMMMMMMMMMMVMMMAGITGT